MYIFFIWILGLFIGVSVLSMVEALEFTLRIIFLLFKRSKKSLKIKNSNIQSDSLTN
jgi:hypothetical protein